ncbi:hypothetical protein BH23GEM3_BH23GEM3_00570 [soil metagenome]
MGARLPVMDAVSARNAALTADGWQRRFVAAAPRLHEMTELYRSLGLDVRHEPLDDTDLSDDCGGCILARTLFRIIYTRTTP